MSEIRRIFRAHISELELAISYKTASMPAMLRICHEEGTLAEVVSEAEFELARRLGIPASRCVVNGPGKSAELMRSACEGGALLFLDSLREIALADAIARESGRVWSIGLRVALPTPDAEGVSRFGLEPSDELERARELIADGSNLRVIALHAHVATRRRSLSTYRMLVLRLADAWELIGRPPLEVVDLGGGFPWPHADMPEPSFPPLTEYAELLGSELNASGLLEGGTRVLLEPGLALFNDCVSCLMTVVDVKRRSGRPSCVVDGGVHLVKPTLHGLHLPTRLLDQPTSRGEAVTQDLCGRTCLEFDVLAEGISLPRLEEGDRICVENVGAYTFGFKPPFIFPRPAFYAWDGEIMKEVAPVQTVEEMYGPID